MIPFPVNLVPSKNIKIRHDQGVAQTDSAGTVDQTSMTDYVFSSLQVEFKYLNSVAASELGNFLRDTASRNETDLPEIEGVTYRGQFRGILETTYVGKTINIKISFIGRVV